MYLFIYFEVFEHVKSFLKSSKRLEGDLSLGLPELNLPFLRSFYFCSWSFDLQCVLDLSELYCDQHFVLTEGLFPLCRADFHPSRWCSSLSHSLWIFDHSSEKKRKVWKDLVMKRKIWWEH